MTEVQLYAPPESSLIAWARDASEAFKIAQSLVKTSFVPAAMRNKPEEATAAILTGAEVGLSPMAALRSIDIIQGTPAMRAVTMRGLVQAQGHEIWIDGDPTPSRAVVCGRRKDSEKVHKSVWTIERAKQLGLASKDNWQKQPQAMLVARATSEVCRLTASDVLLGLPYSIEEIADLDDSPSEVAKPKTAKRKTATPVDVAPPEIEPAAAEVTPEPAAVAEPDLEPWPETPVIPGGDDA